MTDNRRMLRAALLTICAASVTAASVAAQANLTGEWAMEFTTPRGHAEYTLYLTQEGPRLNGHLTSEYGETQVKGTINGDEVKLAWSIMEGGKPLDLTVTATAKGDSINGTIRLGNVGEGPFAAERTGS
jgi:hypothetical protein